MKSYASTYKYRPIRFYISVFIFTWLFWVTAIFTEQKLLLMFIGLCMPAIIGVLTIYTSKSVELKKDFKRKLTRFYDLNIMNIVISILTFALVVVLSIVMSLGFGESLNQLSFSNFSFSIDNSSALLTILLASVIEEFGWRSYGEDSIAFYNSWFKESVIFGIIWSLWHLPLFFIEGSYHYQLISTGIASGFGYIFAINFLISVIPLGFLTTWVYVKNNRSMLACITFHMFVNLMQEKIAMTDITKCVETLVLIAVAIVVIRMNKEMFFEKKHIGSIINQ